MSPEDPAPVVSSYLIQTPGREVTLHEVADVTMGAAGELVLADAVGGCLGIFAPGEWRFVTAIPMTGEEAEEA
jgi:hypothetical protein